MNRRKVLKDIGLLSLTGVAAKSFGYSHDVMESDKANRSYGDLYSELGVRHVINARGVITIIGGCRMHPEIHNAMKEATKQFVELGELADAIGEKLGNLTGSEWGMVSTGACGALVLGTAGVITGGNPDKLWQIPDLSGLKNEVIVPNYSWTAYGPVIRGIGVKMINVNDSKELEEAIGPNTAMVMVLANKQSLEGPFSLKMISNIAKPRKIPILVDAAAEGLYLPNPHILRGADMVAYSGGKVLRGPQCSGLLLGRKNLVKSAWMASAPHHGFARGYKVGREEMVGMLRAVEMWKNHDYEKENNSITSRLENMAKRLKELPFVRTFIKQPDPLKLTNYTPRMTIEWDLKQVSITGENMELLLWEGDPRIAVSGSGSFLPFPPNQSPNIEIDLSQSNAEEDEIIFKRIVNIFSNPPQLIKNDSKPEFNLDGLWDLNLLFEASEETHQLLIEQKDSNISGTHFGSYGKRDIEGEAHGDEIMFYSSFTRYGARINFKFTGQIISDNLMRGQLSLSEYGDAKWEAKRHYYKIQGSR